MRLIAIAAIALAPAVVLGQSRTHIRVSKDGTHSPTTQQSTNGDVYTAPAPAPAPADTATPAPAPMPDTATPAPAPLPDTTAAKTDSTQMGTGAVAPTPTHSMQSDSTMSDSTMRTDSTSGTLTTTPVDTVRVPSNPLNVSPADSAKIGIPATRETQSADSARHAADTTTATPPPR